MLSGLALTDDVEVPHDHYAEETMAVAVVPNRNASILYIASGVAVARGIYDRTLQTRPPLAAVFCKRR